MDRSIKESRHQQAEKLRHSGCSYQEIADELEISKNTAFHWTKNISLDQNALSRIKRRLVIGQSKSVAVRRKSYEKYLVRIRKQQERILNNLPDNSSINILLCALIYWCEGAKDPTRVTFVNSDPKLVGTFLTLLRKSFSLDESKFRVVIHLHEYHDEATQKIFWSNVTGIKQSSFTKSYMKPHTGKVRRKGYPGCIAVRYYDAKIAKILMAQASVYMEKSIGV